MNFLRCGNKVSETFFPSTDSQSVSLVSYSLLLWHSNYWKWKLKHARKVFKKKMRGILRPISCCWDSKNSNFSLISYSILLKTVLGCVFQLSLSIFTCFSCKRITKSEISHIFGHYSDTIRTNIPEYSRDTFCRNNPDLNYKMIKI